MGKEILRVTERQLKEALINMLVESASTSLSTGELSDCIDYANAVLTIEPGNREAHRLKTMASRQTGDRLLARNPDELNESEIDLLLSVLIDRGVTAGTFSLSDLSKLDSPETKRELVKFMKGLLK